MLHKDFPGFKPGEDHYIYFDGPWTSLVKTITMFVGELEFSDIPIDPDSKLSWLAFSFLVTFDFLTNWPQATFLARLPAMALCYQVYELCPCARRAGHAVTGATGILLFFRFVESKPLKIFQ